MFPWSIGLLIAAFVLFVIDAIRAKSLTAAGLACLALAMLLRGPFLRG
jgi:hypothetical protein